MSDEERVNSAYIHKVTQTMTDVNSITIEIKDKTKDSKQLLDEAIEGLKKV